MAVVTYLCAAIFSRQFFLPSPEAKQTFPNVTLIAHTTTKPFDAHTPDLVLPIFTLVELACYLGWIKVAEALLNPFGGK